MKRFLFLTTAVLLIFVCIVPAHPTERVTVSVTINGTPVSGDAAPFIDPVSGRVMVPIRMIADYMGAAVDWDAETQTVSIHYNGAVATLIINTPLPNDMGTPVILDGRTFVPVRYVAEIFGAQVKWDAENRTVHLTTGVTVLYSLSTDRLFQANAIGVTENGIDELFSTPFLWRAGNPDYQIVEGPYGNAIRVFNRRESWYAVDFAAGEILWDFANHTYTITVIGNIEGGGEFVIYGADSPYYRYLVQETDINGNFTASIIVNSQYDIDNTGSRSRLRFTTNDNYITNPYTIYEITVTQN